MKLMFASDVHGSAYFAKKVCDTFEQQGAEKLVLLGDILYHGPRNDLPKEYNPKEVISLFNDIADKILCVRGNCDTEVDQMVLDFPVLADYAVLFIDGIFVYISHGHIYNPQNPPKVCNNAILINGHTHILAAEKTDFGYYLNPGSVSIPKEGNPPSYMIYEDGRFTIKSFDSEILKELDF